MSGLWSNTEGSRGETDETGSTRSDGGNWEGKEGEGVEGSLRLLEGGTKGRTRREWKEVERRWKGGGKEVEERR